tara:strand:- start:87 stop:854 length:768 start_codon:yes stop_codon:yes gene_type:complete
MFDFWKQRKDSLDTTLSNSKTNNKTKTKTKTKTKDLFYNVENNTTETTQYQPPLRNNFMNSSLFINPEEKAQYEMARGLLDGNDDSLVNTNGTINFKLPQNDIIQSNSTLFSNDNNINTNNPNNAYVRANNYNTIGDYATLDTLGKGLTDTLGGIHTELGYTVLEEQLGTFKKEAIPNPHAYDNTSNYNTGINPKTVDGVTSYGSGISGKFSQDQKQPIFLQKDFDGVANIFAPNIIVQNPPLTSDGYPDISFEM